MKKNYNIFLLLIIIVVVVLFVAFFHAGVGADISNNNVTENDEDIQWGEYQMSWNKKEKEVTFLQNISFIKNKWHDMELFYSFYGDNELLETKYITISNEDLNSGGSNINFSLKLDKEPNSATFDIHNAGTGPSTIFPLN